MAKQKRISIRIPLRSIGLKRFIEKTIKDDEFFQFALENPVGAMKECGIQFEPAYFAPKDFAVFFGALSGVKEVVKKKKITDLTFEGIFGRIADLRGTHLMAEVSKGFYKDWDINIGAHVDKGTLSTMEKRFDVSGDTNVEVVSELAREESLYREGKQEDVRIAGVSFADPSKETSSGSDKQWDKQDAIRKTESTNGWSKNFDKAGWGDIFGGPLIYPEDLVALASRIEAFAEIAGEVEY